MTRKGYTKYNLFPGVWQGTIPDGATQARFNKELLVKACDAVRATAGATELVEVSFETARVEDQFLLLLRARSKKPESPEFWGGLVESARETLDGGKPVIFLRPDAMVEVESPKPAVRPDEREKPKWEEVAK